MIPRCLFNPESLQKKTLLPRESFFNRLVPLLGLCVFCAVETFHLESKTQAAPVEQQRIRPPRPQWGLAMARLFFGFLRLCCALFFPKSDRCCLRLCFSTPSARIDNHPKRHELQTLALQEPCFPSQKTREVEKKLSGLQKVILRTISFRCFLALKNSSKKLSGHQKVFFNISRGRNCANMYSLGDPAISQKLN